MTCGDLPKTLAGEALTLYAQPVCDVVTRAVVFEELLLRVRTPGGQVVGPGELLATAERNGAIAQIDEWVLGRAAGIADEGRPVSVNLSAQSVSDPEFLDRVDELLDGCPGEHSLFTLEITETALMSDLIQAARFAEHLRAKGCEFALDDFGTGYAPLTYLKHLPIRYLKIDMSFVRDLPRDPRNHALICGIVALAEAFQLQTVAEGVEDEETLGILQRIGVDLVQGYLVGRPVPVEKA